MSFAETANLHIRGYRAADLDRVTALLADVHTQRGDPGYVVPGSEPKGKKTVEDFVPKLLMFCVLEAKAPLEDGSDWVGICTFANKGSPKNRNAMFGICLEEKFWGRGYATEAIRWLLEHAFNQLGMHRVSLGVNEDNPRAIALYKKCGFVEEGRERRANFQDGRWWDMISMGILEEEWREQNKQ